MTRGDTSSAGPVRRLARLAGLAAVLGVLLVLLPVQSASAHAYVLGTSPADGVETQRLPATVRVTFDEPVTLPGTTGDATVLDAAGDRVDTGEPRLTADRTVLVIGLRPGLPHGTYIASWSVVSADTHPVGGSIQFGYGVPAAATVATPPPTPSPALTLLAGLVKGVLYLGLVLALGVLPAAALLGADDREHRTVVGLARVGGLVAIAASLAQPVVQYLWDASASRSVSGATAVAFAGSSYALAAYLRLAALIAAVLALPRTASSRPVRYLPFAAAAVVAIGSVVVNGHGGAGPWWRFVATALHAVSAVAWIGGLAVLGWLLLRRRLTAERLRRMPRWSLYAGLATVVLVLSGALQALVEVGYPGALVQTPYGIILVAKVVLVVVALALGASGLLWTRAQLRPAGPGAAEGRPAPGETARLRGRVRREAAVTAAVVVLSGVLSSITPARDSWAPDHTVTTTAGPWRLTVEIGPTRRGPETFKVTAVQPTFNSPLPESVGLELSQVDGPVRDLEAQFPYRLAGVLRPGTPTPVTFTSAALSVPRTGEWAATITIVVSEFEQYAATVRYRVQ